MTEKCGWILLIAAIVVGADARVSLTLLAQAARPEPAGVYSQRNRAQSLQRDVSFVNPPEVMPGVSCTTASLRVCEAVNPINGVQLRHRSYNGALVGPTLRVRPGQSLRVNLRNELPMEAENVHAGNAPHGFNVTNLHTHGLHVSPQSPADDVYKEIAPGESFEYRFDLPGDHPAGTFWYHAHKHGSTALQLASGMSGALIVEGGLDEIPEIRAAEEQVMVLQQFTYRQPQGEPAYIDPDGLYQGEGEIVTAINGVVTPTIVMRPGEVQRWRLIHAGTSETISLDIEGIHFYEIAVDGLATGRREETNRLTLFPGYRSDVLIKAPLTEGTRLMYTKVRDRAKSLRNTLSDRRDLLRLVIAGSPRDMPLPSPTQLAAVAPFKDADVPGDEEIVQCRVLRFSQDANDQFLINGEAFDPANIAHSLQLNTAEEWELISEGGTHPFHIHVNPFAIKPSGEDQPWLWRDTVALRRGRTVTIRMRCKKFTGKTVLHCHNLLHEDQGMMQAIRIVDSASGPDRVRGAAAFPWTAVDATGVVHSSEQYQGRRLLLVLHRGMECLHCAEQLQTLMREYPQFEALGIQIVAISPYLPDDPQVVKTLSEFPFPVLIDPELKSFREFGCITQQGSAMHGLFLIDSDNQLVLERRTETAIAEPAKLVFEMAASFTPGE